jgi:hypothetical protein
LITKLFPTITFIFYDFHEVSIIGGLNKKEVIRGRWVSFQFQHSDHTQVEHKSDDPEYQKDHYRDYWNFHQIID